MQVMPFRALKTNHLLVGNCVDELYDIPANSIDLTVTSPVYDKLRITTAMPYM